MSTLKSKFLDLIHVHPFVKWAGGKGQLLSELDSLIPRQFNRYFEPFLGGGAMFFRLVSSGRSFTAYLSDTNVELITTSTFTKKLKKEEKKAFSVIYHLLANVCDYYSKRKGTCQRQYRKPTLFVNLY
jgi:DNA adenine methylase